MTISRRFPAAVWGSLFIPPGPGVLSLAGFASWTGAIRLVIILWRDNLLARGIVSSQPTISM